MPQIIGIDIGERSVKAVVADRSFRELEIHQFVEVEIPEEGGVRAALAELAARVARPGAHYGAAVSGHRVALRVLSLPFSDARKIAQILPGEVEGTLPFDLDDIVYDNHVAEKTSTATRLLIAAVRKEDLAGQLALLSEVGMDPRVMEVEPLALGALASRTRQLQRRCVALVDAGHASTGIAVLENGTVTYGRTASLGGRELESALMRSAGVSRTKARELVEQIGVTDIPAGVSSSQPEAVLAATARRIADEIARTLAAVEPAIGVAPEAVVVCGGLALVPGFVELLARTCRLPAEVISLDDETRNSGLTGNEVPRAAAALSLVLRTAGETKGSSINLRREQFQYQKDTQALFSVAKRFGTAAALLLCLAFVNYGVKVSVLKAEKRRLTRTIVTKVQKADPTTPASRLEDAETALSILEEKVTRLREQVGTLAGTGASGLEVLKRVSEKVPTDIELNTKSFKFSNGALVLEGETDSFESIDKIVEGLGKGQDAFAEVEVKGKKSAGDKKAFTITAKVAG